MVANHIYIGFCIENHTNIGSQEPFVENKLNSQRLSVCETFCSTNAPLGPVQLPGETHLEPTPNV